jgi:EAL domain-containing protein (putative c-di-GMP-specific phosphodiesterase class I)
MYEAKRDGRDGYRFYTAAINADAVRRFSLESALRDAFDRDEFRLHYQPAIDLTRRRVVGVEALVRWQHPERGLVPPDEFIPLAEETGLIVRLGEWILWTACAQVRTWQQRLVPELALAVNLSARQFTDRALLPLLDRTVTELGLAAECLELELTESMVMHDTEAALETMRAIRETGARLAIDDFGTGYSSLAYLKLFPISTLKIDRRFLQDIERDGRDESIVSAIVALAHRLGLTVVAEGVESDAQLRLLEREGCDAAQGRFFAAPLAPEACERWLRQHAGHEIVSWPQAFDAAIEPARAEPTRARVAGVPRRVSPLPSRP